MIKFNFDSIKHVDFVVALESDSSEDHFSIPIEYQVKQMLIESLRLTISNFKDSNLDAIEEFEISEKYGSTEVLKSNIDKTEMKKIKELFNEDGWPNDQSIYRCMENIIYYMCVFKDDSNKKIIGVKRAIQFKTFLSQRNRVVQIMNNTLKLTNDDFFKIDKDFDFIITENTIYIFRPSSLEYIAEVDDFAIERARTKTIELSSQIEFIDFEELAGYVAEHRRAARLIASISSRKNLKKINRERLEEAMQSNDAILESSAKGKLKPAKGYEILFLEILDNRRYSTALTEDEPELFRAASRKKVK